MYHHQVEVNGDVTSLDLSSLFSQTEYDVAVTPMYDTGPGQTMIGNAITGQNIVARFTGPLPVTRLHLLVFFCCTYTLLLAGTI